MAYNKDLDEVLFNATIDGEDGKSLLISVYCYNGGDRKLQIGPRTYSKKDGSPGYAKAGRMSVEEVAKLIDILPDAAVAMGL